MARRGGAAEWTVEDVKELADWIEGFDEEDEEVEAEEGEEDTDDRESKKSAQKVPPPRPNEGRMKNPLSIYSAPPIRPGSLEQAVERAGETHGGLRPMTDKHARGAKRSGLLEWWQMTQRLLRSQQRGTNPEVVMQLVETIWDNHVTKRMNQIAFKEKEPIMYKYQNWVHQESAKLLIMEAIVFGASLQMDAMQYQYEDVERMFERFFVGRPLYEMEGQPEKVPPEAPLVRVPMTTLVRQLGNEELFALSSNVLRKAFWNAAPETGEGNAQLVKEVKQEVPLPVASTNAVAVTAEDNHAIAQKVANLEIPKDLEELSVMLVPRPGFKQTDPRTTRTLGKHLRMYYEAVAAGRQPEVERTIAEIKISFHRWQRVQKARSKEESQKRKRDDEEGEA